MNKRTLWRWGDASVDIDNHVLRRGKESVRLRSKSWTVLAYLAEHCGRLVRKAELFAVAWPNTAVTDDSLTLVVREIRRALGDDPRRPRILLTEHGRGYRLVAADGVAATPLATSRGSVARRGRMRAERAGEGDTRDQPPLIVGREVERGILLGALAEAEAGRRQVVFISGEAGLGKTTLVESFLEGLVGQRPGGAATTPLLGRGFCISQYGDGGAFVPFLEALADIWRQTPAARGVLRRAIPTWTRRLPGLQGRAGTHAPMPDMPDAILEALRGVETLARTRTLVLVLEDMHWSDALSVDLLNQMATRRGQAKVLLLVTLRPSASLATGHPLAVVHRELCLKGLATEIELAPLSQAAVETYVRGRLGARDSKPALVEEVFTCTEGHPFFLAGVVDGILGGDSVANGGTTGSKRSIPSTIEKLLARQMESLSAEDNALLECAAVLGLQFGVESAAAMLGKPATNVAASCVRLCHRQRFLRRGDWGVALGEEHHRYAFAHALYRSFLYERISPSRRKHLHRLAADHLSSHFDPEDPLQTSRLAAHLEQAGEHLRAVMLLQESAQRSSGARAHGSAAMSLRQALALAGSQPRGRDEMERHLALSVALAGTLVREGGFVHPELPEALEAVLDLSLALNVGAAQLVARAGLGLVGLFRGDLKMALFECNALHALAAKVPLAFYHGLADVGRGWIEALNGNPGQALVWFERVLGTDLETMPASPIDSGLPHSAALAGFGKALCWTVQGRPVAGRRLAHSTFEEVRRDGLRIEAASAAVLACCVNLLANELKEARRFAMRAADLAEGEAIRTWGGYAEVLLAIVTATEKPTAEGLVRMESLAEENRSRGYRLMAPLFSCFTARVALRLGRTERAGELLTRGFGQIEAGGERLWDAELLRTAARMESDPRKMQARLERAIGSAQEQGAILFEARAVADLAAELHRRGQTRRAIALVESLCASPAWEDGCAELRQLQKIRRALARSVSPA